MGDPNKAISFDADTIAQALVNIYQKKYGNGTEPEPTLFEKTKEIFSNAVSKGWRLGGSPDRNSAFFDALCHNTDVFSAFRVHKMQSDIAAQLLDGKGQLKPFGKFLKDVKPYVSHQNRAWLETEYNTAVLRAHQAADWKQFEAEKDVLPNLKWQPSTSPNPGADHQPYWFTVLPIDHEFWTQHRPGDRWNCKCSLRSTDKPATDVPKETLVKNLQPSKGLETNPGTTGEIFSDKHPYFPENCGQCPFNKGVGRLFAALVGKNGDCFNQCKVMEQLISKNEWQNITSAPKFVMTESELTKVKGNGWDIPFKNAKEMNESAIGGFNILRFEKVINSALDYLESKGVNIDRTIVAKSIRIIKGEVHFIYNITAVRAYRIFKVVNQTKIVIHQLNKNTPQGEGIGSALMLEQIKQYISMNISKIELLASDKNGGYTWAKMGFWCKDKEKLINQIKTEIKDVETKDIMLRIVNDYYSSESIDSTKPFPMLLLANEERVKNDLIKIKWEGFLDLKKDEHIDTLKDYLHKKLSNIVNR